MDCIKFLLCKHPFDLLHLCRQMPVKLDRVNIMETQCSVFLLVIFMLFQNFSLIILKIDTRLQTEHKLDVESPCQRRLSTLK